MADTNDELHDLTYKFAPNPSAYGFEISTDNRKKSKCKVNTTRFVRAAICTKGVQLDEVQSFKYLGATTFKDESCAADISLRIASAMAGMARLNKSWDPEIISFITKFRF